MQALLWQQLLKPAVSSDSVYFCFLEFGFLALALPSCTVLLDVRWSMLDSQRVFLVKQQPLLLITDPMLPRVSSAAEITVFAWLLSVLPISETWSVTLLIAASPADWIAGMKPSNSCVIRRLEVCRKKDLSMRKTWKAIWQNWTKTKPKASNFLQVASKHSIFLSILVFLMSPDALVFEWCHEVVLATSKKRLLNFVYFARIN